ncbi:DUF5642 family protein [Mycolicibacterium sp. P1-5]|uniref:DUF5642 family protein n=1 Tax=Mycolicibacterium sp. P1-5 TaxID=2024617 RepID=UPI001D13C8A0|nr:DUF5642 family protein [Mycolicibacterium sp. P1-5]
MRQLIVCLTTALSLTTGVGLAACVARPTAVPSSASSSASPGAGAVNPANIKRVRASLPAGYEIADVAGPVSAPGLWGFGAGWTAAPPHCAALSDPAPNDPGARGYSASGAGGTIYVVVALAAQPAPDDTVIGECARWTMTFGHTTGDVVLFDAPRIDGAQTVAMTVTTRTVVESGTETDGQAVTAQAYSGGHVVFVTLITDPGSPHPPLDSRSVGDLLVATVAALRG